MTPEASPMSSTPEGPDDIDPDLLRRTQAYLEVRSRRLSPAPELIEAWEQFFRIYAPLIGRYVGAHRLSEADRNDCIQETWREIIARLPRFRLDPGRGRLRTWIYAVARNKVVDVVRRRSRHPIGSLDHELEATLSDLPNFDPAVHFERRRTQAIVRGMLVRLSRRVSPRNYRVLYMRWIEERTVPEIAEALGLTPEQVRFRHHRAKQALRRLFEDSDPLGFDGDW
jgi:RNA polymerase sigma factor (sigma-70 family)